MKNQFIPFFLFVLLLGTFGCCDQRTAANPTIGDNLILIINANADFPILGCTLAKQSYHLMDSRDRERVKAVIELQTKNERSKVSTAALQTLADLRALDKIL